MSGAAADGGRFRAALTTRHRLRPVELLPLAAFLLVPVLAPAYLALATQVLIAVIFAIAIDLCVGYAGIVTLGHAVYFGLGAYTAGILSVRGMGQPLLGLLAGAAVAGVAAAAIGGIILRTSRFTLLILSLGAVFLAREVANAARGLTGGVDGLPGIVTPPLFGRFEFDLYGHTGFGYAFGVVAVIFVAVRWLVHTPLGQTIAAVRDNPDRAAAIGIPVLPRLVLMHALSGAIAGIGGALQTEISQFVGLNAMGFELSANGLVMLALGGAGRLYGAFIGPAVFLVAQDRLSHIGPAMMPLWIGTMVIIVALFVPGGLLGLLDMRGRWKRGAERTR